MLNFERLAWGARRLATGRRPPIEEVATDSFQICPEEYATCPKAIFLEGALEKIKGYSPWTTEEYELRQIFGGHVTHAATRAYLMRNIRISGAWIYCGAYKAQHGYGPERAFRKQASRFRHLGRAHLVSNFPGSNFFGNFLLDDFPLALIPNASNDPIVLETNTYQHEAGYREIFGLPRPPVVNHAQVDELIVYVDFAQNSLKARRYNELRRRLRLSHGSAGPTGSKNIYLKRGATGEPRLVANEEALEAHLARLGFDVVEPAILSAQEISRRVLDAQLVVSTEGSHLSHAIYSMAEQGAFLILQPPDRFSTTYKAFTDRMGMRFAFLIGDPADGGFSVDLDDLDRLLERLA